MAGYNDTKELIIKALMGRPIGTEIQPEDQQAYELNMLDYIRGLELISTSTLVGLAEPNTVPVQPKQGRVCYIAGVSQNQNVIFQNFIDSTGNPISITTGEMQGVFVIFLWNTEHWEAHSFDTNIISQIAFFDRGVYSETETYNKWDFVTTEDSTYLFIFETSQIGKPVSDAIYWKCIADGKPATLAATAANLAADLANTKANFANEKGIYANERGTFANEKGIEASNAAQQVQEVLDDLSQFDLVLPEELYSYGVQFDITAASASCTRIGNMSYHATKPVHSEMKGCLVNSDGVVTNYLTNWAEFDLSGASGDVMVEVPDSYWNFTLNGNIFTARVSKYPLKDFFFVKKFHPSAYEASVNRVTGKLHSVKNITIDYRGGNNTTAWDATYRSLLGLPATNINRINFQAAARLKKSASTIWNILDLTRWDIVTWLAIIEYGTRDLQQAINPALDANGYSQGGVGAGVTNLDSTKWTNFNGNNPFIPCGYTNSINNGTGQVAYTMPFEYDASGEANYVGVYDAGIAYTANKFVSSGTSLYKCILDAPAGTLLTNTTYYTLQTRTVTYPNRYRGIELPFGHTWKWIEGVNIKIQSVADGGRSEVYITDNPAYYNSTDYTNYTFKGLLARTDGYIKTMILGETGLLLASETGGTAGANAMWCDSNNINIPATTTILRGVLSGGNADNGAYAGFVYALSSLAPSSTNAYIGSRLCLIL